MVTGTWYDDYDEHWILGISGSHPNAFRGLDEFIHTAPILGSPVQITQISDRTSCEYCHGNTKLDDRGNCSACGAPKRFSIQGLIR